MTTTPRFNAIGIAVADMAASLAFYRTLGLDIPDGAEDAPHVEIELTPGVKLMLDTHDTVRASEPDWTPLGRGQMNLAFECASPADVDETYKTIINAGHRGHLEPWDAFWGQRYAVVHDPDGNGIDLYAPLPS